MNSAELGFTYFSKPFTVHLDASATAIEATLSQEDDADHLRLVTCNSRKLNTAERNYPTHQRELLALVDALKLWKHFLIGSKVIAFYGQYFPKILADDAGTIAETGALVGLSGPVRCGHSSHPRSYPYGSGCFVAVGSSRRRVC